MLSYASSFLAIKIKKEFDEKAITALSILMLGYCAGFMSYSFWFTNNHSTVLNSSQAKRKPLDNSAQLPVSTDNRLSPNRLESSNQSMSAVQRSEKLLNLEHALSLADFGSRVASGKAYMLLSSASVAVLVPVHGVSTGSVLDQRNKHKICILRGHNNFVGENPKYFFRHKGGELKIPLE